MTHIDNNAIKTVILPPRSLTQLIAEETNGNITLYMYNSTGIIGFRHHKSSYSEDQWDTYLYEKNLQGDIIAVYDENTTKKISYTYDAWGNFTATYHNGASATNLHNPYTYRGYYYDKDLSLYYLSSRYYDSNTGRFINADSVISGVTGTLWGYNMFVYCFNNPINMDDGTGNWPEWGTKAIVVAAVATVIVAATVATVATFGAGSVAGVAAITTTLTIAARATEVAALQTKKSISSEESSTQDIKDKIALDVTEALYDNGLQIIGTTAVTKSGAVAFDYALSKQFLKVFDETVTVSSVLSKPSNNAASQYFFAACAWVQTTISIFSDDPVQRAEERRYTLK